MSPFAVAAGLSLLTLTVPVVANACFYAARRRSLAASDAGTSSFATSFLLRAFVAECWGTLLCLLAWPLALTLQRKKDAGYDRIAVLVSTGRFHAASYWLLARRLRRHGWGCVEAVLRDWYERPGKAAAALEAVVEQAILDGGPTVVALVAHGWAGLAAREYLRLLPDSDVHHLFTLGTPHQGTRAAFLRRRLEPSSERMQRLNDADPVPRRCDVVAICSDFDAWLVPPAAAYYPSAFNIEVAATGHFAMLTSRQIFELLLENLEAIDQPQRRR